MAPDADGSPRQARKWLTSPSSPQDDVGGLRGRGLIVDELMTARAAGRRFSADFGSTPLWAAAWSVLFVAAWASVARGAGRRLEQNDSISEGDQQDCTIDQPSKRRSPLLTVTRLVDGYLSGAAAAETPIETAPSVRSVDMPRSNDSSDESPKHSPSFRSGASFERGASHRRHIEVPCSGDPLHSAPGACFQRVNFLLDAHRPPIDPTAPLQAAYLAPDA
jgi:hypothetical protein